MRVNGAELLSVKPAGPVLPAGSVFDVHLGSFTGPLNLSAAAGTPSRALVCQTAGLSRWAWGMTTSAESGSNAGGNFALNRYDDTGNMIDQVMNFTRSSGVTNIGQLVIGGLPISAYGSPVETRGDGAGWPG